MVLLDLNSGYLKGWIEGVDTLEIKNKFESIIDYNEVNRRSDCLIELQQLTNPPSGRHQLASGYTLLVS